MTGRRSVLTLAVVVSALLLAWSGRRLLPSSGKIWHRTEMARFERRIRAGGELRSADPLVVGCPPVDYMWQFTITSLTDEGTAVEEGEALVAFDAQRLSERLEVVTSRFDTARKELEKTRLEMRERYEALLLEEVELKAKKARLERELSVPEEIQKGIELQKLRVDADLAAIELALTGQRISVQRRNMEARIGSSESRVLELERDAESIRQSISKLQVTAERSGYVVHVKGWNGEKPKVGETVWKGRPLVEVADLSRMEVAAEIAEPDAGYVAVGQEVEVRLDAAPDRRFAGRVQRLGRLFRTKSPETPSTILDAVISIEEPDTVLMRPGMAVSVEITAPSEREVLEVPEAALSRRGQEYLVEVLGQGYRRVTLGERWEGKVVIETGLEVGDRVRVAANDR